MYLIGYTANFAGKPIGKQLACNAGVAPFEHSSGISIKGVDILEHVDPPIMLPISVNGKIAYGFY